ncbi:3-isopropylmalate dehydrogenase [Chryseomicrobium sp. FSL W7-1435]|uniref:3-isopropylmalate dehydrogenase n=1 Tax=Chryseomicrobium sp. FSL W7-1435 TaxID=2921704 RepID=UPI00315A130F
MKKKITVLPGDGIGPEVTQAAVEVLKTIAKRFQHEFEFQYALIGGAAVDQVGEPLPDATVAACQQADAVLLGSVGGPQWDSVAAEQRPEKGLLALRKHFNLYANLRPVKAYEALAEVSPLKQNRIMGTDFVIVRELTGGLYFSEPRKKTADAAVDTLVYTRKEIERIVIAAFQLARSRNGKLTSVDKANVLASSKLWREIVEEVKVGYPDVAVDHILVDAAAMQLIKEPSSFDVIVTENLFGDILSDEASMITGSLGMLPSASVREDSFGVYEPIHGSAPDIAGKELANPAGAILSAAMLLEHSFGLKAEAKAIEDAVERVLQDGYFTADLSTNRFLSTSQWTAKVIEELDGESVAESICFSYISG